jgi:succinate dehydrogenase / fumarate reductase, iron-sulfur subunit
VNLTLYVWRQKNHESKGQMVRYEAKNINVEMSFLEMLDVVNEDLIARGEEPIAFDSDCREGICGTCGFMINGIAHGPLPATTVCQLHMRHFKDGDTLYIEPWRSRAFPVVKDLCVDRTSFDRIIASGGYISVSAGSAPEANSIPVPKQDADLSMDAAACIACGACVAQCPNGSAMLFTSAKLSHLNVLPQGQPERFQRVVKMVAQMDEEGFGSCTNHKECEAVCPKQIDYQFIVKMNRDYLRARLTNREEKKAAGAG